MPENSVIILKILYINFKIISEDQYLAIFLHKNPVKVFNNEKDTLTIKHITLISCYHTIVNGSVLLQTYSYIKFSFHCWTLYDDFEFDG